MNHAVLIDGEGALRAPPASQRAPCLACLGLLAVAAAAERDRPRPRLATRLADSRAAIDFGPRFLAIY